MFLDTITRPNKIESLIKTLNFFEKEDIKDKVIFDLYQPKGLNEKDTQGQIQATLKVAKKLNLVDNNNKLTFPYKSEDEIKKQILKHFDEIVLKEKSEEKWFALFYSFILSKNKDIIIGSYDKLATEFNTNLFGQQKPENQLNEVKLRHHVSWYNYIGLGQTHQSLIFVNPFDRIKRNLSNIFQNGKNLTIDQFITKISEFCPELDGGLIFKIANPKWVSVERKLSKGMQRSLLQLHIEKNIKLISDRDARDFWIFEDIDLISGEYGLDTQEISGVNFIKDNT